MRGAKTEMILQRSTDTFDSMRAVIETWRDLRIISGVLTVMNRKEQNLYGKDTTVTFYKFSFEKIE